MESDKKQKKRRSAKTSRREAPEDNTSRLNFPHLPVTLDPRILRVADIRQHIIWINTAAAPDANVIYLRA